LFVIILKEKTLMVTIRLARGGSKKRPFYHLTVADSRTARDGRFVERVGFFNPVATGGEVRLSVNQERVTYWLSKGAQPSERVAQLLKTASTTQATA
jgi:ribosomal protein S16